ncbi:hypothetical protein GCM10008090_23720 [Arenicella chitinivorans]|uniref:Amidoligase enzyme n=1 Tax=Arenicella chitinivorans TaxID=1329800 RepID=A0A918VQ01_9GAMM|nr:amidoligase family protein [Arenicella chitinivorans]GHA13251.1 hypothetical protein GCM10008090_23720 [Arenicella chitinivorans]
MSTSANLLAKACLTRATNHNGEPRRIGVELEFAGMDAQQIAKIMQTNMGGEIEWQSPFVVTLETERLGTFKLEMDSKQIQELGTKSGIPGNPVDAADGLEKTYIETVSRLAGNLVPWEIVTPPLPLDDYHRLYPLVADLRAAGARGTRAAMHYAFGVHLNPEPCVLSVEYLVRHLKAFFCLYEWILKVGDVDFSRRITPYINHFDQDYILKVLDKSYQPTMQSLITDYLDANPTRNRSLDMLPMFAYIDEDLVRSVVDDNRINPRPTFHYRLPNCEIDNPDWNLNRSVELWMAVEELAQDDRLTEVCAEYSAKLNSLFSGLGNDWTERLQELLPLPNPHSANLGS